MFRILFFVWLFVLTPLALVTYRLGRPRPPALARTFISIVLAPYYPLARLLVSGIHIRKADGWITILRGNLCFTLVQEGEAKHVVRGGKFEKIVFELAGYRLEGTRPVPLAPGEEEEWYVWGGLRFYGLWPFYDIYVYKFPPFTSLMADGEERPHSEEWTDVVSLKMDLYQVAEDSVESADPLPLKIKWLLGLVVVDPYKAIFRGWEWLEISINRYRPVVRDLVAGFTYEDLNAQKESQSQTLFGETQDIRDWLYDQLGVGVVSFELREIDPPSNYRDITLQRYTAEQEARAAIERVQGEAEAIRQRAQAEAEAIRQRAAAEATRIQQEYGAVRSQGPVGWLIRLLRPRQ